MFRVGEVGAFSLSSSPTQDLALALTSRSYLFLGLDLASSLLAVLTFLLVVETGFYPLDACVLKSVMLVSPRKI